MTLLELKKLLEQEPSENNDLQIVVWLPGTRIDLSGPSLFRTARGELMIEGNVREGWEPL